jgi:hypothetical protein
MLFCKIERTVVAEPEDDETAISEITIGPDGRIYVFGASYEVLQIIERLASHDSEVHPRMAHIQSLKQHPSGSCAAAPCVGNKMTKSGKGSADQENL